MFSIIYLSVRKYTMREHNAGAYQQQRKEMKAFIEQWIMFLAVNEHTNEYLVKHNADRHDHEIEVLFIKVIKGCGAVVQIRFQEQQRAGKERITRIIKEFFITALYVNSQ